jgi:hypothetical protein
MMVRHTQGKTAETTASQATTKDTVNRFGIAIE